MSILEPRFKAILDITLYTGPHFLKDEHAVSLFLKAENTDSPLQLYFG